MQWPITIQVNRFAALFIARAVRPRCTNERLEKLLNSSGLRPIQMTL